MKEKSMLIKTTASESYHLRKNMRGVSACGSVAGLV